MIHNPKTVLEGLLKQAIQKAPESFTLDQRITACRRYGSGPWGSQLEDLERMRHERDAEDYSRPATFYGVVRKIQTMTEEQAVQALVPDEPHKAATPEQLKRLHQLVCSMPLALLDAEAKQNLYDKGIEPPDLRAIFKAMDGEGLTMLFEECPAYNETSATYLDAGFYEPIQKAFQQMSGDAVESFLMAAATILKDSIRERALLAIAALDTEDISYMLHNDLAIEWMDARFFGDIRDYLSDLEWEPLEQLIKEAEQLHWQERFGVFANLEAKSVAMSEAKTEGERAHG